MHRLLTALSRVCPLSPSSCSQVFLGDFIYADVPTGRGKSDQSWFMQLYRQTWGNVDGQRIWSKLPVVQIWDDHEIENNVRPFCFGSEG